MSNVNREIPPSVKKALRMALLKFNQALSDDQEFRGSIANTLERYLNDSLWPSNFRELEKALDRLKPDLSKVLRVLFINSMELFPPLYDELPAESVDFLEHLQEYYSHKYKIGAHRTVLSSNSCAWDTVHVQAFQKNNSVWYGISIVRMDGEHLYFEGNKNSMVHMLKTIQGVMDAPETVVPEEDTNA